MSNFIKLTDSESNEFRLNINHLVAYVKYESENDEENHTVLTMVSGEKLLIKESVKTVASKINYFNIVV